MTGTRPLILGVLAILVTGVAHGPARADSARTCAPLAIDPARVRVGTDSAASLRATGGSGHALFTLEGEARGATIEAGGGLRSSDRAATFDAVARDDACGSEARARVEVVGPFDVSPRSLHLAPNATARLTAGGALGDVSFAIQEDARGALLGASVRADGTFVAGPREGEVRVVARDGGSGREIAIAVDVSKRALPLRARATFFAVPVGARIKLEWEGGSGLAFATVSPDSGARIVHDGALTWLDAADAKPGLAVVRVVDRVTHEEAIARVVIGEVLGVAPVVRGTQSGAGDMVSGDFNGDGRADLVIGHAERSKVGLEAGGVLVFYARDRADFAPSPDLVIEAEHAGDRFGSVLLARDMNGDGIDDLVVGIPDEDLGESDRGGVAIYLGSKRGLASAPDRVLSGEDAGHRFGSAIAAADLTGDGVPDLVVGASGAKSPFAKGCEGGRAYVYRTRPGVRGVVEAVPWQTIDLRDPLTDADGATLPCSATPLGAGRALALFDIDGDRALDLVVGAPAASFPQSGKSHGAIDVYRGSPSGVFATAPTWAIHLDPSQRIDNASFGSALDVVGDGEGAEVLVARSPSYGSRGARGANAPGAMWTFARGSLGAPLPPLGDGAPRVRVVTTRIAKAMITGAAASEGLGRSATIADIDGDGAREYVVGCASEGGPSKIAIFGAAQLARASGAIAPRAVIALASNELAAFRLAGLRGANGEAAGLASFAPWRSTAVGPFAGAIDYVPPMRGGSLAARWSHRSALVLPNFGASDRAGASVALAPLEAKDKLAALVGAPGAHSPAPSGANSAGARFAGDRLRTGAIDLFGDDASSRARVWVDRNDAQIGAGPIVALDFDGDGKLDLAVGDPGAPLGGALEGGAIDPDACAPSSDTKGDPPGRGVVRVYAWRDGAFVERFRVVAPSHGEADSPRARFGSSLAAADVNGDGKDDLVIGRSGGREGSGAEVVLGRSADAQKRIALACHKGERGPMGSTLLPSATPDEPIVYGAAVAGIGDLDRDGCSEIALSMSRANFPGNPARAGVLVAFGYDASGARCRGHKSPFFIRLVPDDRPFGDDALGASAARVDKIVDLRAAPTGMGGVLARGAGDVTGDGVPDLVFRDADLAVGDRRGAAVEIISGAYLASLCPARACAKGRAGPLWSDGDWNLLALRTVPFPYRRVIPARAMESRFASAIALSDMTGDGAAEIAIGVADGAYGSPFAGEVRVYKGGAATTTAAALAGDPWLVAVGDASERGAFGSAVATARDRSSAWLLAGAPLSSRAHLGGDVGAAYLWRIPTQGGAR